MRAFIKGHEMPNPDQLKELASGSYDNGAFPFIGKVDLDTCFFTGFRSTFNPSSRNYEAPTNWPKGLDPAALIFQAVLRSGNTNTAVEIIIDGLGHLLIRGRSGGGWFPWKQIS